MPEKTKRQRNRRTDARTDRKQHPDVSRGWKAEYHAQGVALPDGGHYILPDRGARVRDREADENGELLVVDVYPNTAAADYPIGALDGTTVAEVNPEYDTAAPVVDAVYLDDLEDGADGWRSLEDLWTAIDAGAVTAYSFPADRLTREGVAASKRGELA